MSENEKNEKPASLKKNSIHHNKLLAFSQRRIPYIPELKSYCHSVAASIIMQQLEYWFSNKSNGFYKFMSPCNHEKYRTGDSWTEELNLTVREFRGGFDKIGCRYRSKRDFLDIFNTNNDVFKGKYYLSYIDIRSGLTVYLRNHKKVDQLLTKILKDFSPSLSSFYLQRNDLYRDAESASPEMTNVHLQRLQMRISGDADMSSPIKETKKNNREYTKTTATISDSKKIEMCSEPSSFKTTNAAAVKNKKSNVVENQIEDKLTEVQKGVVQCITSELTSFVPSVDRKTLEEGIIHTLCDPESFTQAGNDFFKKLNTIQKAIRKGKWKVPVEVTNNKAIEAQRIHVQWQYQWREYYGEYRQLQEMLESAKKRGEISLQEKLQQQIDITLGQLKNIESQVNFRNTPD